MTVLRYQGGELFFFFFPIKKLETSKRIWEIENNFSQVATSLLQKFKVAVLSQNRTEELRTTMTGNSC